LLPGLFSLYKFLKPSIWSNPLNTLAVHWFSNVLWFDVSLVVILSIQRRLTNEALIRLLFLNIFAFLLIWEYVFQMSSFLRTPTHSLTVLFLFSVGLLWLLHTVGWDLSSKSSPAWPAAGRLSIYGGIATFALLEIFARTACSDFKMMNELFLAMFHGVIDIGLPYYFLVWTTNRVKKLPVKIPALLGVFCVGAATALIFNVLEKFAAVGCSLPALNDVVNTQCRTLREIGSVNIDLAIPEVWYFARAAIYTGALGAVYAFSKRKFANRENASDAILFLLVAFGSGIASFAETLVELPLPTEVRALLAPCTQELLFDCNLFQNYLAYWIPALLLGLAQLYGRERATKWFLFAIPPAMAAHFFISWSYSQYEVYWRACGSLYTILLVPAGIFVIFVALYLNRFASTQEESERDKKATLLTPKTMIAAMAIAELILIPLAFVRSNIKFDHQQMPAISRDISISKTWQRGTDSGVATFVRRVDGGQSSLLQIGTIDSEGLDSRQLLKKLFVQAAQSGQYPNLAVVSVEPWGKYYPNALACNFAYEIPRSNPPMTMAGISVLVPSSPERTEFYTLHTLPSELDHEQYELAWTIKNLGVHHTK
jgi:hypothetical protein